MPSNTQTPTHATSSRKAIVYITHDTYGSDGNREVTFEVRNIEDIGQCFCPILIITMTDGRPLRFHRC